MKWMPFAILALLLPALSFGQDLQWVEPRGDATADTLLPGFEWGSLHRPHADRTVGYLFYGQAYSDHANALLGPVFMARPTTMVGVLAGIVESWPADVDPAGIRVMLWVDGRNTRSAWNGTLQGGMTGPWYRLTYDLWPKEDGFYPGLISQTGLGHGVRINWANSDPYVLWLALVVNNDDKLAGALAARITFGL